MQILSMRASQRRLSPSIIPHVGHQTSDMPISRSWPCFSILPVHTLRMAVPSSRTMRVNVSIQRNTPPLGLRLYHWLPERFDVFCLQTPKRWARCSVRRESKTRLAAPFELDAIEKEGERSVAFPRRITKLCEPRILQRKMTSPRGVC